MSFSRLNSKRIAVVIPVAGEKNMVVRGVGTMEEDDDNGDVLRVTAPSESGEEGEDSAILVRMTPNPPTVQRDGQYGCDYCVVLDQLPAPGPEDSRTISGSVPEPHKRKPEIRKPPVRRPPPKMNGRNGRGGK